MTYAPVPNLALTHYFCGLTLFNEPYFIHVVGTHGGGEVPFAQLNAADLPTKSPTVGYFIRVYFLSDAGLTSIIVDFFIVSYKH